MLLKEDDHNYILVFFSCLHSDMVCVDWRLYLTGIMLAPKCVYTNTLSAQREGKGKNTTLSLHGTALKQIPFWLGVTSPYI